MESSRTGTKLNFDIWKYLSSNKWTNYDYRKKVRIDKNQDFNGDLNDKNGQTGDKGEEGTSPIGYVSKT
jgi:hypothetical protein